MDPHDEFFVAINTTYMEKNRWRDKYILRYGRVNFVLVFSLLMKISRQ